MDDDDIEELDNSWIKEFKDIESDYDDFYKEKPSSVKLFFIYVDSSNNIESMQEESYLLDHKATIPKINLIHIIKNKQCLNDKIYRLISLMKFNITIEPEDVPKLLELSKESGSEYLTCEKNLNDIKFGDTVCILQDINALYFIFYADIKKRARDTKRILLSNKLHKTRRKRA